MITFTQVSKIYDQKEALRDFTCEIVQGRVVGLLGPNGAGKTTTMKLLVGLISATKGKVRVDGLDPSTHRLQISHKIGFLLENNPLYPQMRVSQYLSFIANIKRDEANIDDIVEQVGLLEVLNTKIEKLSRGYKQRVGLASALLGSPSILVLDEPTSGLDPIEQEKIRGLIRALAKTKTIILSTHILGEVEEVADDLLILNEGKMEYFGIKPKGKGEVEKLFMKKILATKT